MLKETIPEGYFLFSAQTDFVHIILMSKPGFALVLLWCKWTVQCNIWGSGSTHHPQCCRACIKTQRAYLQQGCIVLGRSMRMRQWWWEAQKLQIGVSLWVLGQHSRVEQDALSAPDRHGHGHNTSLRRRDEGVKRLLELLAPFWQN